MIVIADDITGAAEMAGIAHSYGLQASLLCSVVGRSSRRGACAARRSKNASKRCNPLVVGNDTDAAKLGSFTHYDVLVIATDTRSMTEDEAVAETRRIVSHLLPLTSHPSPLTPHLFKKIDSALRGHVIAELKALMVATGYKRAVYMPANPSKGRIIKDGVYYIKEVRGERCEVRGEKLVPLHETAFSYDPEFPALTSSLCERFPDAEASGIIMPDAETIDDIRSIVTRYNDGTTLFAGAADLFRELLQTLKEKSQTPPPSRPTPDPSLNGGEYIVLSAEEVTPPLSCRGGVGGGVTNYSPPFREGQGEGLFLILCGSTQSKPQELGLPESPMPLSVYNGSDDLQPWLADALPKYEKEGALMLTIPYRHRTGQGTAIHLRTVMAQIARQIVGHAIPEQSSPTRSLSKHDALPDAKLGSFTHYNLPEATLGSVAYYLIIEGGATAWATFQALGWNQFDILQELAPGIVQMRASDGTIVTLKPGSYPWTNITNV